MIRSSPVLPRAIATCARRRSTRDRTRSSATSSPSTPWGSDVNFDRTEEQELVAASIARFIEREYSFETRRRIVSSPAGYSEDIWRGMAELGLLGLLVPDHLGGLGGGAMEAMPLMEAIGSALVVEPWLATAAIGARFIARAGSVEQRALLARVSDGTLKLAVAHAEPDAPE